jgi:eukaryotic-like serine/threonine-protein kinase
VLPMGDHQPSPFLQSEFGERQGQFSPDGRWVAYSSDESGRYEVYVQSFPTPGGKWQISTSGGAEPNWRRDGTELFYLGTDHKLMAVEVKSGSTFETTAPRSLFDPRILMATGERHYAVSADGQRFLVNTILEGTNPEPINIVVNWTAELPKN